MSDFDRLLRALDSIRKRRRAEEKLRAAAQPWTDTCHDISGYRCTWVITSPAAFEKHLKEKHPEGEHR